MQEKTTRLNIYEYLENIYRKWSGIKKKLEEKKIKSVNGPFWPEYKDMMKH